MEDEYRECEENQGKTGDCNQGTLQQMIPGSSICCSDSFSVYIKKQFQAAGVTVKRVPLPATVAPPSTVAAASTSSPASGGAGTHGGM